MTDTSNENWLTSLIQESAACSLWRAMFRSRKLTAMTGTKWWETWLKLWLKLMSDPLALAQRSFVQSFENDPWLANRSPHPARNSVAAWRAARSRVWTHHEPSTHFQLVGKLHVKVIGRTLESHQSLPEKLSASTLNPFVSFLLFSVTSHYDDPLKESLQFSFVIFILLDVLCPKFQNNLK